MFKPQKCQSFKVAQHTKIFNDNVQWKIMVWKERTDNRAVTKYCIQLITFNLIKLEFPQMLAIKIKLMT